MGSIILGGFSMVRGQFSGVNFPRGAVILGGNCPGGVNFPRRQLPKGSNYPGGNHPKDNYAVG